jgi:outer membrane usher protein
VIRLLAGCALIATILVPGTALAAERVLVLEVVVNGRPTGRVGEFLERDGAMYARPSDLVELGFVLPQGTAMGADPIPLSALPDFRAHIDEARQMLLVQAGNGALRPTELSSGSEADLAALSPAGIGMVLNYDLAVTYADGRATGGALAEVSAFSPYGVLQSSALVNLAPFAGQRRFVRLDTTFTGTEFSGLRRWRLGDVVTGALPWSRAVRLGGVQIASDFGLRPDLVTYPLPKISGSAAVPSTVNVMVNGIQQLSQTVQPGPFAVRSLPVVTGSGEIAVTMSDPLGRQTLITLPFYASAALLRPGLASYSLEFGSVRENFGQSDDRYAGWAASLSTRYGLNDELTLEGHGEATDRLQLLGGGFTMLVGTVGVINIAGAGSIGRGQSSARSGGAMVAVGFERRTANFSIAASGTYATAGYRDIAAEHGAPMPKASFNASLGYQFGWLGSLGIAYSGRISRARPSGPVQGSPDGSYGDTEIHLITGSYSVPIAGRAAFYATGFKDLNNRTSYGIGVGISFSLGRTTASAQASWNGGQSSWSANVSRSAQTQNDFGYRAQLSGGAASRGSLEGEYLGAWGRVSAGADLSSGRLAGRAGARGALVLAGGSLFASDQIHDSFAVVSTGDVAGVPVLYENRPIGNTDARGKLLIPSLLSYRNNRLAIDATRLPPDVEVGQTWMLVRPPDRSGVTVDFNIRRVAAALLTLHDRDGRPIPLGSTVRIAGATDQPVGYDGEAYVAGLKPVNRAEITQPDGTTCGVQFDYAPVSGEIPLIGPVRCQ